MLRGYLNLKRYRRGGDRTIARLGRRLPYSFQVGEALDGVDEAVVASGDDFVDDGADAVGVDDVEDAVVEGVVEEDGAADADATAEALEVVPHHRGRGIAVEEDEVDLTGVDLDGAGVADDQLLSTSSSLAWKASSGMRGIRTRTGIGTPFARSKPNKPC